MKPSDPKLAPVAICVERLAHRDRDEREAAATKLHRLGCELARSSMETWIADADFLALVRPGGRPFEVTVGIAVRPETFENIRAANGSPRLANVPPDQDAREFELQFKNAVRLDVLTTKAPGGGGAIARFLEKFGEGIQQVEFAVTSVDRATEILRSRLGQQAVYPETRPGADRTRVNFFLAGKPEGKKVLIELVEIPRSDES